MVKLSKLMLTLPISLIASVPENPFSAASTLKVVDVVPFGHPAKSRIPVTAITGNANLFFNVPFFVISQDAHRQQALFLPNS